MKSNIKIIAVIKVVGRHIESTLSGGERLADGQHSFQLISKRWGGESFFYLKNCVCLLDFCYF